jgi:hypothetical protein
MHKLTKQGVRDLGENRRHRVVHQPTLDKSYRVDIGPEYGQHGIILRIGAQSVRDAIREAQQIIDNTYTAMGYEVIQVHDGRDIVWDYMNGFLK